MMASTVRVRVAITGVIKTGDEETSVHGGWTGSGVIYDKDEGLTAQPRSRILSANHVLAAPTVGSKMESMFGDIEVTAVEMTIQTNDGRTCNLVPLRLGADTEEDVATGEADCDAGPVAVIASSVPAVGETVYVSGHPLGVEVTIVTDGFVSGWYDKYMLIAVDAAPGNSGGPVFYRGEVVGLLVRGSARYSRISLMTPLAVIQKRIQETPRL